MKSDIDRWNKKYLNHEYSDYINPDPLLVENRSLLAQKGNALDLACGVCDNALFLAKLGNSSFAIDGSVTALCFGKRKAKANGLDLHGFVADLDSYPLPVAYFDVIVVFRYLNRDLIAPIRHALRSGGVLLYQTFNKRFLEQKPTFSEEYVLSDGELMRWFGNWHCIKTNDDAANQMTQSFWLGKKPNRGQYTF
ncbi:MAG: class I SAM-dependent methyltransferase [Arenicellales bacterium]|nr:class I SAM-dependent methyltransferase [Arenicellales bacterium]